MHRRWLLFLSAMCCFVNIHIYGAEKTNADLHDILTRLDTELQHRDKYISMRQMRIDSLEQLRATCKIKLQPLISLAKLYTSFDNDSALVVYSRAYDMAMAAGQDSMAAVARLERAALLPLGGFTHEAVKEYSDIDTALLGRDLKILYHSCGRQMYSYLSSFYSRFAPIREKYASLSLESQRRLVPLLPQHTPVHMLNQGEYFYLTGDYTRSHALLSALIATVPEDDNQFARAAHMLADIADAQGRNNDYIYYLALSAISDTRGATREVTSLQELGQRMFQANDVDRAHNYLYTALRNAVECNAEARMLQTSAAVPLIESVHSIELRESRHRIYIIMAAMAVTLLLLLSLIVILRRKMAQMRHLQLHLQDTNRIKEEYISQFLNLCSIYMDKLNQFCHIANRKISTGKVDDLYQLTKSGKFVENQSKEFYEVFDNAFIHIHPEFVDGVNRLLKSDCRITLMPGQLLNTDLRILAFMRLGIDDTSRVAQILNYSVHTIYAYRNKMKNRAINRDTFEADIMAI